MNKEKSFYEREAEVSQNLLKKIALGQRIEELKKDFSGSADYMSGVNDGMYHLMQNILPLIQSPSAEVKEQQGVDWKQEYDQAVNEIGQLQEQLRETEKEIRQLLNELNNQ